MSFSKGLKMNGEGGFVPVAVDVVIPKLFAVCEKLHSKGWRLKEATVWEVEAALYVLLDAKVSDEDAAKKLRGVVTAETGVPTVLRNSCEPAFQQKLEASPLRCAYYPI